jgi:hypothetical protein
MALSERGTVPAMGLRSWFFTLLDRGTAPEIADDEPTVLLTGSGGDAALAVAHLHDCGIEAHSRDAFNVGTHALTDHAVIVRHADLDAARSALAARDGLG